MPATQTTTTTALLGDEEQLYQRHAKTLRTILHLHVTTTDENLDDACSFAWMQLVRCQPRRETVFAWLRTVAIREAIRLDRQQRRAVCADLDELEDAALRDRRCDLDVVDEALDALDALGNLRERQRVIYGLQAFGYRYADIAAITGDTLRTVDRQMRRARRAVLAHRDANV